LLDVVTFDQKVNMSVKCKAMHSNFFEPVKESSLEVMESYNEIYNQESFFARREREKRNRIVLLSYLKLFSL